ncbi:sigma-70 family RNA polymerase sigma factor [Mangrovivirga sp. M17]|uniref:Sigma-70 family RNA polymerase sigma factor n=1 Tax=Mangrovivirga halotolerans TaxID=2993936 RepID=A0ABT3RSW1_9BACT|nr:sigma-70 family RNA polymerase sigma factor [Mangrovivirga halotolerans]MCX2744874.1 sigma-70 family RNA polymerase sigma factor [Mangrovivirga halotolerans]
MNKIKLDDSQLVSQYIKGSELAFEKLVNRHKNKIFTKIYLIVKDRYVAEDLLQETFIKAVNTIKAGKYNEEGKFLPWIMRIANNMAIDHFRKEKRYPTIVMEDGSPLLNNIKFAEEPFETDQERKETHKLIRKLVKELPESQKQVLIMRHYMKMSFQEIADATGVSINTALGRMRYALINMKKKMDKLNVAYDKNLYPG